MLKRQYVNDSDRKDNDIIFSIALWCKFKQSVAIISSCKNLWHFRKELYKRKHLLWYNKPLLDFWTPEQNFYASGCQFTLLIRAATLFMDIHGLYQQCNIIEQIKDDYDYCPTFNIENCLIAVWHVYSKSDKQARWSTTFHSTREEIKYKRQTIIELEDSSSFEYVVIDLKITIPCWIFFNAIEPMIDHEYEWVSYNSRGKIISGE